MTPGPVPKSPHAVRRRSPQRPAPRGRRRTLAGVLAAAVATLSLAAGPALAARSPVPPGHGRPTAGPPGGGLRPPSALAARPPRPAAGHTEEGGPHGGAAPAHAGALRVEVRRSVPAGVPFVAQVMALGRGARNVAAAVYLSSADGNLLFLNATCEAGIVPTAGGGPTSCWVTLARGRARLLVEDLVPGATALRAQEPSGPTASAALRVTRPVGGPAVAMAVYANPTGCAPPTATAAPAVQATVAAVDFLDTDNGLLTAHQDGGFWPLGTGTPYAASWNATLFVRQGGTFRFLNVADDCGGALLTPLAGSGARIDGAAAPVAVPTETVNPASAASPVAVTLAPGEYALSVWQVELDGVGGAGDSLLYAAGASGGALEPVPPRAFTHAGLPPAGAAGARR